jgi:hypothetical protein
MDGRLRRYDRATRELAALGEATPPGTEEAIQALPPAWRAHNPRPVVLVVWAYGHAHLRDAIGRAEAIAAERVLKITSRVVTVCPNINHTELYALANSRALISAKDFWLAFWLVPHDAVTPDALQRAQFAARRKNEQADATEAPLRGGIHADPGGTSRAVRPRAGTCGAAER